MFYCRDNPGENHISRSRTNLLHVWATYIFICIWLVMSLYIKAYIDQEVDTVQDANIKQYAIKKLQSLSLRVTLC